MVSCCGGCRHNRKEKKSPRVGRLCWKGGSIVTREMREGGRMAGKAQLQETSEGSAGEPGLAAVSIRAPHVLVNIELGAKERATSLDNLLQTLMKHQLIPGLYL